MPLDRSGGFSVVQTAEQQLWYARLFVEKSPYH
jgi:hypothetical protein